ncbi:MAG: GNAT family N-acetyltransferase [Lentimicrobiaceae bacterium]|nr:GNAT family N-acetyltransferase [Lentimicrobiaceae bacterium]
MIRKATHNDIPRILELLSQVNDVHAEGRPDFFIKGKRKYNEEDLLKIINDDTTPVFVYVGTRLVTSESGTRQAMSELGTRQATSVQGYAFCVIQDLSQCDNLRPDKSLYIDDICVDENYRRHGVGKKLYEHVLQFAKEEKCFNITLNVWAKNPSAQAFYESMGMTVQKVCMEKILIDN